MANLVDFEFYEVDDMKKDLEAGVGAEEVYKKAHEFFD